MVYFKTVFSFPYARECPIVYVNVLKGQTLRMEADMIHRGVGYDR